MKRVTQCVLGILLSWALVGCDGCRYDYYICYPVREEEEPEEQKVTLTEEGRWYMTARSKETLQRIESGERLTVKDIIHMHQADFLAEDIIAILQANKSETGWTARDLGALEALGVARPVLRHLAIATREAAEEAKTLVEAEAEREAQATVAREHARHRQNRVQKRRGRLR